MRIVFIRFKLHMNEGHPDTPLLEHVKELVEKLDALGIKPSPVGDEEGDGGQEDWEDVDGSEDEDGDVEMA